jgi:hypothetical protein
MPWTESRLRGTSQVRKVPLQHWMSRVVGKWLVLTPTERFGWTPDSVHKMGPAPSIISRDDIPHGPRNSVAVGETKKLTGAELHEDGNCTLAASPGSCGSCSHQSGGEQQLTECVRARAIRLSPPILAFQAAQTWGLDAKEGYLLMPTSIASLVDDRHKSASPTGIVFVIPGNSCDRLVLSGERVSAKMGVMRRGREGGTGRVRNRSRALAGRSTKSSGEVKRIFSTMDEGIG